MSYKYIVKNKDNSKIYHILDSTNNKSICELIDITTTKKYRVIDIIPENQRQCLGCNPNSKKQIRKGLIKEDIWIYKDKDTWVSKELVGSSYNSDLDNDDLTSPF